MRKAQDLMLKYNLSMGHETGSSEIITDSLTIKYHLELALIIAENFRMKTWAGRNTIYFIGYKEDVIAKNELV